MKKLITLLFTALVYQASAQVTLYTQNFNSLPVTDWSLNTTDLGGVSTGTGNQWLINNIYAGGPLGTATATEPGGITGSPTSNYLHINCGPSFSSFYGSNCNFLAGMSGDTYFAAKNTAIVTTGYNSVTLTFWWLCNGSSTSVGKVYYRTSSSGAWTAITTPTATYFGSSAWAMQTVVMSAFDNQAVLEFGFQFTDGSSGGNDPAFGIDDIKVIGTPMSGGSPVASFTTNHTTICSDSTVTFTSTSTGTIDSVRWTIPGVTIATPTVSPITVTFPTAGTYNAKLKVYSGALSDSVTHVITVTQSPHPVITKSGHTLSVAGSYTSYQWYNLLTPITGATNSSYTYTVNAAYGILVDSGGCMGIGAFSTLGVNPLSPGENSFWLTQSANGGVTLYAAHAPDEALSVTIHDATGRKIIAETWNMGDNIRQIDASILPPGLYMVRLSNSNSYKVLKWLKE